MGLYWVAIRYCRNRKQIRLTLDMPKSFDLPSESEPRFTVNPDPDPTIK